MGDGNATQKGGTINQKLVCKVNSVIGTSNKPFIAQVIMEFIGIRMPPCPCKCLHLCEFLTKNQLLQLMNDPPPEKLLLEPMLVKLAVDDCEVVDALLSIAIRNSGTLSINFFFRSRRSKQSCGEMPILIMMSLRARMETESRSIFSSSSRCWGRDSRRISAAFVCV